MLEILDRAEKVLVVAAHPDDEVLGCGGTIARMAGRGTEVHVAFLADGETSRFGQQSAAAETIEERRNAARNACQRLMVKTIDFGGFPDNRMDVVPLLDIVKRIEELIDLHRPDTVLTHHVGDVNIDHRRTHEAMISACRPQTGNPVRTLLCFEIPSSTEWQLAGSAPAFVPNWFVDISDTLEAKLRALAFYSDELRDFPHPRSMQGVEHLARWRGATVGVLAAEAYVLGRQVS
jgi:N-acetylglucosamine malate deacetylase 1